MKYRIREHPQVDSKPKFWIEVWGHKLSESLWSNKKTECWCYMDTTGCPINKGYGFEFMNDYSDSFKSLKEAQTYLDNIIEYRKKEVKTVFEIET